MTFLEIYDNNKNKNDISIILNTIYKFIVTYEKYSLYINFIDDEGYKTFIKNKYYELYNYLPNESIIFKNEYKSLSELRKYLLTNKKFKIYSEDREEYIEIIKKDVNFLENSQIGKIFGILNSNDIELLCNKTNEKFYKEEKAKEVQKLYEKFDFDKRDINQRNKYINNYIDNYLKILE